MPKTRYEFQQEVPKIETDISMKMIVVKHGVLSLLLFAPGLTLAQTPVAVR